MFCKGMVSWDFHLFQNLYLALFSLKLSLNVSPFLAA
jgi:hypothetical protein